MAREPWIPTHNVTDKTGGEITLHPVGLPLDPQTIEQTIWNVDALRRGVLDWGGFTELEVGRDQVDRMVIRAEPDRNIAHVRGGTLSLGWDELSSDEILTASQFNREVTRGAIGGVWAHNVGSLWTNNEAAMWACADILSYTYLAHSWETAGVSRAVSLFLGKALVGSLLNLQRAREYVSSEDIDRDMLFDPLFVGMRPVRAAIATGFLATHNLVRTAFDID